MTDKSLREMSEMRCLVELLKLPVIEACLNPASLDWVLLQRSDDARVLLLERTHRGGIRVVMNPNDHELADCRVDPWRIWNRPRAVTVYEAL
jgi:hypothetical protein